MFVLGLRPSPAVVWRLRLGQQAVSRACFWDDWRGSGLPAPATARLAPVSKVNQWMADESLVDPQLGLWGRTQLWCALRVLAGLDVEDFLQGARVAHTVVLARMYQRDFEPLEPVVSPRVLDALKSTMETIGAEGRRIEWEDGCVRVLSCRLRSAEVLKSPDDARMCRRGEGSKLETDSETDSETDAETTLSCHLHVHIVTEESWRMVDYSGSARGEVIPAFDGTPRRQSSTWVFAGSIKVERPHEHEEKQKVHILENRKSAEETEHDPQWTVHSIVD